MGLGEDLTKEVAQIFRQQWSSRDGYVVPTANALQLSNDAINIDATVLYADMSDSTSLVDAYKAHFAAEVYKAFLECAAKIIRSEGGEITAYDGDRVMAIFVGDQKDNSAARTALKLNHAVKKIINPGIKAQYPSNSYELRHVVGVDASKLYVARTGIRGANDLVWVGRAANHAAKMATLSNNFASRISPEVYNNLDNGQKYTDGKPMWEKATWDTMGRDLYRSTWTWGI
jgi:class 3 adenylate cyclase